MNIRVSSEEISWLLSNSLLEENAEVSNSFLNNKQKTNNAPKSTASVLESVGACVVVAVWRKRLMSWSLIPVVGTPSSLSPNKTLGVTLDRFEKSWAQLHRRLMTGHQSGQILMGFHLLSFPFELRSCDVAIIWRKGRFKSIIMHFTYIKNSVGQFRENQLRGILVLRWLGIIWTKQHSSPRLEDVGGKVNRFVKHVPLRNRNLCCLLCNLPQTFSSLNQVNYSSITFKTLSSQQWGSVFLQPSF